MRPITRPTKGSSIKTKIESCQLMVNMATKQMIIMMGFLNIISSDDMMEFSISAVSPTIRDMTSPLRSEVKKPTGKVSTLS